MTTLAHAVPELSPNQLSRRQARALRVLSHMREIELGLHLNELRAERVETAKLLRAAAEARDIHAYTRLVEAMATLRADIMRLAQVPTPPKGRDPLGRRSLGYQDLIAEAVPIDGSEAESAEGQA